MSSTLIDVIIAGQEYRLAVASENEATLRESVRIVDTQMQKIRSTAQGKGLERVAVMAAISIASDLLRLQTQYDQKEEVPLAAIKDKIDAMEARLDNALAVHCIASCD